MFVRFALVPCLLCCFLGAPAWAHKAIVFAYLEADELVAEAGFSGGNPAKNCGISLRDLASGEILAQGRTDSNGLWRVPLPATAAQATQGMVIVLDAGEGHRAEWKLAPDEYLNHVPVAPAPATSENKAIPNASAAPAADVSDTRAGASENSRGEPQPSLDSQQLRNIVEHAVADAVSRELAPLKRQLLQPQGPDLRDILGGIGYLVGLAGLFAYSRSRKA